MSLVEKALKKIQDSGVGPPIARREALAQRPPAAAEGEPLLKVSAPIRRSTRTAKFNRDAIRAAGLLPPEHQERQIADQYRQIKRPLIAAALHKGAGETPNGHLVMVTSALPGDGKTFTSINLALSMSADRDINVLLIDADVAKRHVSKLFEVEDEPGLLDALHDEAIDIESLVIATDVAGLSVLPAGRRQDHASELLASKRMREIVEQLSSDDPKRVAILDSAPLLLTSEARVLAQIASQIVVVVRADKTPQHAVLDALGFIEESKSVGLVLNQSLDPARGYYYAYGEENQASER